MFNLAHGYARNQMSAYVELQEAEFAAREGFYCCETPERGWRKLLDAVTTTIEKEASTGAFKG